MTNGYDQQLKNSSMCLLFLNTEKIKHFIKYRELVVILTKLAFRQYLCKYLLIGSYTTPLSPQSMCTLQTLISTEIILHKL